METGFDKWTYFAAHLEDALAFGGPFVFAVWFPDEPTHWQFRIRRRISPKRIKSLTVFMSMTLYGEPQYKSEADEGT